MLIRVLTAPVPGHRRDYPRSSEPVRFGVPLPRGLTGDPSNWRLSPTGAVGAGLLQTRVLDRWSDGSARWVLVDARVDSGPGRPDEFEIDTAAPSAVPGTGAIEVSGTGGVVVVDTGAGRFTLGPGSQFPFTSVECDGSPALDATAAGLWVTDRHGVRRAASIRRVLVEEQGPLRVTLRLDGVVQADAGRLLSVTGRAHFFAGLRVVCLSVTLTNPERAKHKRGFWDLGDAGSVLLKDVALRLALTPGEGAVEVTASAELSAPFQPAQAPFEVYQDSSGGERWQSSNHVNRERKVPVTFRGYRVRAATEERHGLRATPVVRLRRGALELGAAVQHFWQNFPKALEADETGLTLRLFPGQFADLHELQGGEQKTHECWLSFGKDDVSPVPLDWCRSPTLACVDPGWTLASSAVPFLAPLDRDHASLVDAAIDGPDRFELKREVIDEFGWRHFGEIYGDHESVRQKDPPIVSHYNNQYDPIAGFILQYLRTGDARWWTMADELAAHVVDIDVYHTTRDKSAYNHGLFWHTYHYGDADTATHRTYPASAKGRTHGGGPSADHNYTTGLMLHYFLTGDEASRQAVIDLGQFVIDMDDGGKTIFRWLDRGDTGRAIQSAIGYFGPGRGSANSLNALLDAHRLSGEARFLDKAEQLVGRVIHPGQDIDGLRLDVPEQRWFYTMFLQALGKYLEQGRERGMSSGMYAYGRASLLHFARWMCAHEHPYLEKPEKLEFPTETWAAQDIRKSDVLWFAAANAAGDERDRFRERAQFFQRYAIETLAQSPTRALARPVVVLLTSGLLDGWTDAQGDAEEAAEAPGPPVRDHPVFVPQRARAERKLKLIAVAGLAAAVLVALAMVWR